MQFPFLVERVPGDGYRARAGEPLPVVAEGSTREEALANFQTQLQAHLRDGTELVSVDIAATSHPLAEFAGMYKDDRYFDEVVEIMAENRRKMDRDPKIP